MFELAIRLVFAGGIVLLAGVLGWDHFNTVAQTAFFIGLYAGGDHWLDLKGKKSSASAGLTACLDSVAAAILIASSGLSGEFGFLVLAPIAYAAAKYGSLPSAMAPIAACALLGAQQWFKGGARADAFALAQAGGILLVGLLLNHRRIIVSVAHPVLPEHSHPTKEEDAEGLLELRENYRKLKDMYQSLQRKSRRDRHSADLRMAAAGDTVRFHKRLASQLRKLSGIEGLSVYTVGDMLGSMVVRAVEGSGGEAMTQSSLHVSPTESMSIIRQRSEEAVQALAEPEAHTLVRNVIFTDQGRIVGLASLRSESSEKLEEAAAIVEELAPVASELIREHANRQTSEVRLRRAELLYDLASATAGASSRNDLAARAVAQLGEIFDLETISIAWIDGDHLIPAATHGAHAAPLSAMSFAEGEGEAGWIAIGCPEVAAFDVGDDARCRRAEMAKQRIQSFALAPIGSFGGPAGCVLAASPRSQAIGIAALEALRLVADELHQALIRLERSPASAEGLMPPGEFHRTFSEYRAGCLVYLEPIRRQELIEACGRPAFEGMMRKLAHRLRARLPRGGALCRRQEGDFIAFVPDEDESAVRRWANEAAASASLISVPMAASGKAAPLAVRAKVARIESEAKAAQAA